MAGKLRNGRSPLRTLSFDSREMRLLNSSLTHSRNYMASRLLLSQGEQLKAFQRLVQAYGDLLSKLESVN